MEVVSQGAEVVCPGHRGEALAGSHSPWYHDDRSGFGYTDLGCVSERARYLVVALTLCRLVKSPEPTTSGIDIWTNRWRIGVGRNVGVISFYPGTI